MKRMTEYMDPESALAVEEFFDSMGLPVPTGAGGSSKNEFYRATGDRDLVFLTDYGVVIRLTPKDSVFKSNNPHFILPLFNRVVGNYEIAIDPGYDSPVTQREEEYIYNMMRDKYGVIVDDEKPENLCFVPGTKYPILIDLDPNLTRVNLDLVVPEIGGADIRPLSRSVKAVKNLFFRQEANIDAALSTGDKNPQIKIYAPLRESIEKAWPTNCDSPDPQGIKEFKFLCKEFLKAGKLSTPWADEDNDYRGTTGVALNYAQRLKRGL